MQVYLVIVWRGQATVPTGSPLPLAAPARGERLLRQRVLEVLAAEAYGDATLASSLREELQELASDHFGATWKHRFSACKFGRLIASTSWCFL
ncbi:unnamed protein product [Cladocopium goreaui]|uniref:Uncharacterized protein n=1 Tax=Cladocopium goreaui TaxID=2562237 RepID=A0A9P1BX48_9DINO|nr:unnamed protein product [Cladocopium goreaui]